MQRSSRRICRGFTLTELVITMVLMGIISAISSGFIASGAEFFFHARTVQKINSDLGFVTKKLEKLIQNSIPNSMVIGNGLWTDFVTFVPAKAAFGYFYVARDGEGGIDQSVRQIYAVKSPFYQIGTSERPLVAFSGQSQENYYKVTKVDSLDGIYRLTIAGDGHFAPLSENGRLYLSDPDQPFVTVCHAPGNRQIRIFRHADRTVAGNCAEDGTPLVDDVESVVFRKVDGAYNAAGELEVLYQFDYRNMDLTGQIVQRIGVRNAP